MPVMDGKAFLSASRAEPAYATIPVALFTTALGAETLADSLGVQACIAKPFDLDIFTNAVRQLVSTEAQPPEATPEWPLEMPEWLIESMRSELLALDRRIHETRRTLDRAHDRVIASDACLHRAFERLQRSGRLVSARALASS
jgi:DNA-binding response OmpR family regulator